MEKDDPKLKRLKQEIDQEVDQAILKYEKENLKKEIDQVIENDLDELIRNEVKAKIEQKASSDENKPQKPEKSSKHPANDQLSAIEEKSKEKINSFKDKTKESWSKCQGGICLVFIAEVFAVGLLATLAGIGCANSSLFYCVEETFFGAAPVMLIISAIGLLIAAASFVLSERDPGIGIIGALINLPVFVLIIFLIFNYLGLIIFVIALLLWFVQINRQSYY